MQEVSYKELVELRVQAALWAAPRIVVAERTGRVQTFPVRPADLSSIQTVLDRADLLLGPSTPPLRFELLLVRLLTGGVLVFLIWLRHPDAVIKAALGLAALLPVPTSLAMLAAASVSHAFAMLEWQPFARQPAISLAFVALAVVVLWEARGLAHKAVYRSKVTSIVLPLVLGAAVLIVAWAWSYLDSDYLLSFDARLLSFTIASHPDTWISAVSLAGGLLSLRNRWATVAAFFVFACAIALVVIAKGRVIF